MFRIIFLCIVISFFLGFLNLCTLAFVGVISLSKDAI